jgi:hypothetical protein
MTLLAQFAATGGGVPQYIEDVFSTYLYTGNGSTQTITNGIDLSTKGGLVWIKDRDSGAKGHALFDTARGVNLKLQSQSTGAQFSGANQLTAFNTTGFALGSDTDPNGSGTTYASWTFREQSKFFDIVTYTGTGSARTVAHSLGSIPGCIIVKRTDTTSDWQVYHRANTAAPQTDYLVLNSNDATADSNTRWNDTQPTDAVFSLGTEATVNASGGTYVAYLWAHDAGGFGLAGTDNVVSCGGFSTDSGGKATINLGYEPQWVMFKRTDSATFGNWYMVDNMRGFLNPSGSSWLWANTSNAEQTGISLAPSATGFSINFTGPANWVYVAVRRGPMKVPTDGTKVFTPKTWTGTGATANVTGIGFPSDLWITHGRTIASQPIFDDRLRGAGKDVFPNQATAETTQTSVTSFAAMDGVTFGTDSTVNTSTYNYINWALRRAPGYFDEVCYTGDGGVYSTQNHNLAVVPELVIAKCRSAGFAWQVWASEGNVAASATGFGLDSTAAAVYRNQNFTSYMLPTTFTPGLVYDETGSPANGSGSTYVAYLFATCAGVSKVGKYTGTGTTQQVDCGFTAGARFVMIKRTDSTGAWYVWDSARGIIAGNDPYVLMNTNAVEVTGTDYVDTAATGFEISSTAPAAINANGGTFIFLAIA